MDLQSIGDSACPISTCLSGECGYPVLGIYRRTKILEEYNKDLVSFSEEV